MNMQEIGTMLPLGFGLYKYLVDKGIHDEYKLVNEKKEPLQEDAFEDIEPFGISIPLGYEDGGSILSQYAVVKENSFCYGIIDQNGQFVVNPIEIKREELIVVFTKKNKIYSRVEPIENTVFYIAEKEIEDSFYCQYGLINSSGKVIIPFIYNFIYSLSQSLFWVERVDENEEIFGGVVDVWGDSIIPLNKEYNEYVFEKSVIIGTNSDNKEKAIFDLRGHLLCTIKTECSDIKLLCDKFLSVPDEYSNNPRTYSLYGLDGKRLLGGDSYYISMKEYCENVLIVKRYPNSCYAYTINQQLKYIGDVDFKGFEDGYSIVEEKYKEGLIDVNFDMVIPFKYNHLERVAHGLYKAYLRYDSTPYYITSEARMFVPHEGTYILFPPHLITSKGFQGDYCIVFTDDGNYQYGLVDKLGQLTLPAIYDCILLQANGLYYVKKDNMYGVVSEDGSIIRNVKYNKIQKFSANAKLAMVAISLEGSDQLKYGFIDKKGKEVLPLCYSWIGPKKDNNTCVVKGDFGYAVFNLDTLTLRMFPEYSRVCSFSDGLYAVNIGGKEEVISTDTNDITDKKTIFYGGEWGYINEDFDLVIPLKYYDWVSSFNQGYAIVSLNHKRSVIDKKGKEIIPCIYDRIDIYNEYFLCRLNNEVKKISKEGVIIEVFPYEEFENDSYSEKTEDYSYDQYGGYNGYDDATINSAFDGDPLQTWNID